MEFRFRILLVRLQWGRNSAESLTIDGRFVGRLMKQPKRTRY